MKLFISKTPEDSQWLKSFCDERKWKLDAQSLIEFSEIPFEIPANTEVVFFSSKNGVRYFFEQAELPKGVLTACVGQETARVLKKNNVLPDFVGDRSGDPDSVGRDFLSFLGGKKVFFPTSNASLHTVANHLPEEQNSISPIYETKDAPKTIAASDLYIFTSPSNAKVFFQSNQISENAKVIAWGNVTAHALFDLGAHVDFILETAQKEELLAYLAKEFVIE